MLKTSQSTTTTCTETKPQKSPVEDKCCLDFSSCQTEVLPKSARKETLKSDTAYITLKDDTDYITREYVTYRCQEEGIVITTAKTDYAPSKKIREVTELLKKQCYKYEKQYDDKLKMCCEKLSSSKSNASRNFFNVAQELFSNNKKWEHVIVLMAFSGRLAIDYVLRDMMEYIECLIGWLSIFLFERLGEWIRIQGGWVSDREAVCIVVRVRLTIERMLTFR